MIEILNRFLIQNRSISIPGLGTLHAERVPARINQESSALLPPGFSFKFDKYFDAPDKAFFLYLSAQKDIPEYESMRIYNQFAQDFRSAIMLEEKSEWPGIGFFQKNVAGEVEFVQTADDSGYEPVEWRGVKERVSVQQPGNVQEILPVPVEAAEELNSTFYVEPDLVSETKSPVLVEPDMESAPEPVLSKTAVQSAPEPVDEILTTEDPQILTEPVDEILIAEDPETLTGPILNSDKLLIRIGWGAVAAAAILLVVHFSQHGFNLQAAANQQSVQISR